MCIEFYFWTCEARALSLARSSRTTLFSDLFKQISLIGCRLALGLACQGRRQRTNIHIATNKNFSFLSYFRRIVWSSLSPRRAHTLSISHLTYTYFRWNFVYLFSFGWSKGTTNRHSTDPFCRLTNWNRSLNKPPTKKQRYKKKINLSFCFTNRHRGFARARFWYSGSRKRFYSTERVVRWTVCCAIVWSHTQWEWRCARASHTASRVCECARECCTMRACDCSTGLLGSTSSVCCQLTNSLIRAFACYSALQVHWNTRARVGRIHTASTRLHIWLNDSGIVIAREKERDANNGRRRARNLDDIKRRSEICETENVLWTNDFVVRLRHDRQRVMIAHPAMVASTQNATNIKWNCGVDHFVFCIRTRQRTLPRRTRLTLALRLVPSRRSGERAASSPPACSSRIFTIHAFNMGAVKAYSHRQTQLRSRYTCIEYQHRSPVGSVRMRQAKTKNIYIYSSSSFNERYRH